MPLFDASLQKTQVHTGKAQSITTSANDKMSNVEIEQAIREATNQLNRSSANACRLAENAAPEDAELEGHDSDGEVSFADAIASLPLE